MRLAKLLKIQIAIVAAAGLTTFILTYHSNFYPGSYLINAISNLAGKYSVQIDSEGVPQVNYGKMKGIDIGRQRNPITVSHYLVTYYDQYISRNDSRYLTLIINNADWLVKNSRSIGNYSILEYHFPWPQYNLTAPWKSAMAQGEAAGALIKAHRVTSNQKYLDDAKYLLNALFVSVDNGGVTIKSSRNGWWYEEYVGYPNRESRVLNGMMYTLLDVYDYYQYTDDPQAKYLFDKGIVALKNNLHKYDDNGYSYYDIFHTEPLYYHKIHSDLLNKLYYITGEKMLNQYATRWANFEKPQSILEQIKHPRSDIFVNLIANFVLSVIILEILMVIINRLKRRDSVLRRKRTI